MATKQDHYAKNNHSKRANQHVRREIAAYLAKELDPAEAWRVRKHIEACESCRAVLHRQESLQQRHAGIEQELRVTMPRIGRASQGQLAQLWARIQAIYQGEVRLVRAMSPRSAGAAFIVAITCLWIAVAIGGHPSHANAAPLPPVPMELQATATPIVTEAPATSVAQAEPRATASQTAAVLPAILAASPAPEAFELPR